MKKAKTRCAVTRMGERAQGEKLSQVAEGDSENRGRQGDVNENVIEVKRSIDLTCTLCSVLPCSPCFTIPFSRTSSLLACPSPSLCVCSCRFLLCTCALCECVCVQLCCVKNLLNNCQISLMFHSIN